MFPPVGPQQFQGSLRQWHVSILAPLAVADTDDHTAAVDVLNAKTDGLRDPQATGVQQHLAHADLRPTNQRQELADLVTPQDNRQLLVPLDPDEIQGCRGAPESIAVQELDGEQVDTNRALGPPSGQEDEEPTKLLFRELVGGSLEVAGQVRNGIHVRPLGGLQQGVQTHVLNHSASQFGHDLLSVSG